MTDVLVHQTQAKKQFIGRDGKPISDATLYRWRQHNVIPEPVKIRGQNFWLQSTLDKVKQGNL